MLKNNLKNMVTSKSSLLSPTGWTIKCYFTEIGLDSLNWGRTYQNINIEFITAHSYILVRFLCFGHEPWAPVLSVLPPSTGASQYRSPSPPASAYVRHQRSSSPSSWNMCPGWPRATVNQQQLSDGTAWRFLKASEFIELARCQ